MVFPAINDIEQIRNPGLCFYVFNITMMPITMISTIVTYIAKSVVI